MIQAKFGLNWPSGFRGEDFFLKFTDGRQVMELTWSFGSGELKKKNAVLRTQRWHLRVKLSANKLEAPRSLYSSPGYNNISQ
jgi:hypothetical protein